MSSGQVSQDPRCFDGLGMASINPGKEGDRHIMGAAESYQKHSVRASMRDGGPALAAAIARFARVGVEA